MEFTGERAIPGQTDPDLMNEHWARYAFAEALVGSKRVLDAGCGVGYGAARLAEVAAEVVALDQARDPLTAGDKQYSHPRLRFVQGDCTRFPFADSSLDAVVAFEVIEHLDEWKALIEESRRVLVPAGQFIVSTPNRLYYGEAREDPNPFHVHEFTHDEFREELGRCFPHVMLFLENHADALVFAGEQFQGIRARLETADQAPDEAHFFLAVCSQRPLHGSQAFVYLPSSANLLREREKHIGLLQGEVNKRDEWLAAARVELDKFDAVQESAKRTIAQLEQENADKGNWAQRLDGELAGVRAERERCIQLLEDSEKRVTERTDWAQRLDGELAGVRAERERCIQLLEDSEKRVTERTDWAQRLDGELAGVRAERERCIQLLEDSEKRVTERTDWAQRLDGELAGVRAERERCIQLLEDSEKRVTERTDWAQRLDGELAGVRAERERCIQLLEDSEKRVTERTDCSTASWRVSAPSGRDASARRFREAGDRAHRLGAAARWRVGGCPRRAGEMHPIARRFREAGDRAHRCPRRAGEMHPIARRFREAGDRAHRLGAAARWRVGGTVTRRAERERCIQLQAARRFREAGDPLRAPTGRSGSMASWMRYDRSWP